MNLTQLRSHVLSYGFDSNTFSSRINTYLNDAQDLVARRVNYYIDEAVQSISTVAGTALLPFPADFARGRTLFDTGRNIQLELVSLRDIDRSNSTTTGAPYAYAINGTNFQLYPTPDNVYTLQLRYWKVPAALVGDSDTSTIPSDWHRLLWYWALKECFAADDDPQTAQYWEQQFEKTLAEFAADQKFPDTDAPNQVRGMWDQGTGLGRGGWTRY